MVFGASGGFGSALSLSSLDGASGFRITGAAANDRSGLAVGGGGDVNADGFDDIVVGSYLADPASGADAGSVYVVYGAASRSSSSLNLATLTATHGFRLDGAKAGDHAGRSVGIVGDVDGDGIDDIVAGADLADPDGRDGAGSAHLVFGDTFTAGGETQVGDADDNTLTATDDTAADILIGGHGEDTLISDGGADVMRGGSGDDILSISDIDFSGTRRLHGGSGTDTLSLNGSDMHLDLTAIADNRISDIEAIDLRGTGANTLTLSVQEVLRISTHSNTLIVRRNAVDTVHMGSGWTQQADESIGDAVFNVYTQGVATLKVQKIALPELTVTIEDAEVSENGGSTTATVERSSDTTEALTVTLTSSDTSEATVPATVVIPAGRTTSDPFTISAVDDFVSDETQTVTISASAEGHESGTDRLDVINVDGDVQFTITGGSSSVTEDSDDSDNNSVGLTIGYNGRLSSGASASVNVSHVSENTTSADYVVDPITSIVAAAADEDSIDFDSSTSTLTFYGDRMVSKSVSQYAGAAGRTGTGDESWENVGNAVGNTSDYASVSLFTNKDDSDLLRLNSYGLDIPTDAEIEGIAVKLVTSGSDSPGEAEISLTTDGTTKAATKTFSNPGWSSGSHVIGGSADDWGESWTAAQLNASSFGLLIQLAESGDYRVLSAQISVTYSVLAPASTSLDFNVEIADDDQLESNERFSVVLSDATIEAGSARILEQASSASSTITDNDTATAVLSAGTHGNEDGPTDIVFTVTLDKVNHTGAAITFDLEDLLTGTATSGVDYTAIPDNAQISVADGARSGSLSVAVTDDFEIEQLETLKAKISGASNGAVTIGTSSVTASITDDDKAARAVDLASADDDIGFRLDGEQAGDSLGFDTSSAGDFNGDGFDDVIVSSRLADPNGVNDAGASYLVFGQSAGFTTQFSLSSLDGANGFRIDGISADDATAWSVSSVGDINSDGYDDVIIGARLGAFGLGRYQQFVPNSVSLSGANATFGTLAPNYGQYAIIAGLGIGGAYVTYEALNND